MSMWSNRMDFISRTDLVRLRLPIEIPFSPGGREDEKGEEVGVEI